MYYYEVCIFYSRKDSRSLYVKTDENMDSFLYDENKLNYLCNKGLLSNEDAEQVTDIFPITKEEYLDMTGHE